MALRNIVQDGDPVLKKVCRPVTKFDGRLATTLDDMKETLQDANGLGLAAPQVGVMRRYFIALEEPEEEETGEGEEAQVAGEEQGGAAAAADGEEAQTPVPEPVFIEFINPEILEKEGEVRGYEGCLSFPGKYGAITRPARVRVKAFDREGNEFEYEATGMLARCLCHETNHLDGITIDDLAEYFYNPEVPHDLDVDYTGDKEAQGEDTSK